MSNTTETPTKPPRRLSALDLQTALDTINVADENGLVLGNDFARILLAELRPLMTERNNALGMLSTLLRNRELES